MYLCEDQNGVIFEYNSELVGFKSETLCPSTHPNKKQISSNFNLVYDASPITCKKTPGDPGNSCDHDSDCSSDNCIGKVCQ